ncbi:MAG: type II toxin-antitoxin system HicB family antitoxin [Microcystis sp. LE19-84.1B]|jgi:predicted RNase H-like HicB family nuclease|uniref:Type II toxin-antitoxin system HicB family antitoxin n=1 Tax=Microcystis aeruginosa Ma_MB_F_20061100_S20D TaxID=2486253 RepID=A0A552ENC9_MICAE|nr:type II toxin-antitoxin system HicB family antitoxin [Microcystis sp. LE19-84.1B]MCZ8224228.1 type II toxin-antitoxin system HicB family antitoxin [Microcystis sp. LE19-84.1B]TRU34042.1 MAG: type II toxin-antitoxin system HicB family antitoxin [Microcystis aeruginosa Ma_MB_F_20061100_S20]TRU35971.1 MAG: type II toxin-antitoxin system HicB family antitoxin [Microcystis aeruginosa Ma_MB_F_20061100_S20D]
MKSIKIIVEKHPDGYIAYPLGIEGVVIGEGDSYQEALEDAKSALRFHIETFGVEVLDTEYSVLEASIIVR